MLLQMEEADSDYIEDELSRTSSDDDMINRSLTLDPRSLYGSISGSCFSFCVLITK